jgi:G3E family GTPase
MDQDNYGKIPVTILTGFLGAGKTTLLNQLIRKSEGKKLAIIENEFGEVPIDNELVIKTEDGIFELSNGCICCTLSEDLTDILVKLINRKDKIDHLIIETTGIADPGPVANAFLSDYKISALFRVDSVIAVADAQHVERQLEIHEEACKQIAIADVVLINKTDRVDGYSLDTASNIIKRINPFAKVLYGVKGEVESVSLLELNLFSARNILKTKLAPDPGRAEGMAYSLSQRDNVSSSSFLFTGQFTAHKHTDISSYSFVFSEPLDPFRFDIWIRMTLNRKNVEVYRVKGILQFKNLDQKIIFQAVNNQYSSEEGGLWKEEERLSKIVFIGKHLDREYLRAGLKVCSSSEVFDPQSFYSSMLELGL